MVFIKKSLIIFFIFLLFFSLVGCENNGTNIMGNKIQFDSPPSLKILYQDKSIDAKRGTYSWTIDNNDGSEKGIESDSVAPPKLVKNSTPLTVPPKSSLTLSFSDKSEDVIVNIWQHSKPIKQQVIDDKISTSELKGYVIYEVVGKWKQGIVHYAFSVIID